MAKASKLTSMLHTSCVFKEAFSAIFGNERSIPASNATRWNSVLKQIQGVITLDHQKLSDICKETGKSLYMSYNVQPATASQCKSVR